MKALMAVKFCILRRLNHAASTVVGAPEKRTYAPAFYVFLSLFSFPPPLARIFSPASVSRIFCKVILISESFINQSIDEVIIDIPRCTRQRFMLLVKM